MNPQLKKIEKDVDALKRGISKLNTKSVFDYISYFNLFRIQDLAEATGLHSPQKELYYLAGLITSNKADGDKPFTENLSKRIFNKINVVVNEYGFLFSPTKEELSSGISQEWRKTREVSLPVFMDYFVMGELASEEQIIDRVNRWFLDFNDIIKEHFGISVEEILEFFNFLRGYQKKRVENQGEIAGKMKEEYEKFKVGVDNGSIQDIETYKKENINALEISRDFFEGMKSLFEINISTLKDEFGNELVNSFIKHYTIEKLDRDFKFFTETNHFELSPIWKNGEILNLGFIALLHVSIYKRIYDFLSESPVSARFYTKRDKETEKRVESIFQEFLNNTKYEIYSNVFEDPYNQYEHDLVIDIDNFLLIVETKASKRKEPFRDPEKSFTRIRRDFDSDRGIQKAYDQGLRLKQNIQDNEKTVLYDGLGKPIKVILRANIKKIYVLIITAERFGIISSNLSLLLKKPSSELFPWSCYINDLDTLLHSLKYLNHTYTKLLEYLDFREKYHKKLFTTDELEIAGYFLTERNIKNVDESDPKFIFLSPELSRMFDKIYFEEKGIPYKNEVPSEFEAISGIQKLNEMISSKAAKEPPSKSIGIRRKEKMKKKQAKKIRKMNKRKRK